MFNFSLLASYFDRIKYPDADGEKYYLYEEVWADYAKDFLSAVYMYAAIALAVVLIGIGIFIKLKKGERFASFVKTATGVCLTFALTVIVSMLAVGFAKISEKGYAQSKDMLLELIPPLVLGGVIFIGVIACYIAGMLSKKAFKISLITAISAIGAALIATVVCSVVYYNRAIVDDGYYTDPAYGNLNQLALYLSAGGLVVAAVVACFLLDLKNKQPIDSKCIALAGICIALSFALSYIKIFRMPQGGSITLVSLLPVMLFAYIYGTKKGLLIGFIYGLLQAMQDAYIIHPAQFLLDYPVAFAMVGFAGAFANIKALDKLPQLKFALGATLAGALRFISHVLSGVFAFGAYAMDAGVENFWLYSTVYNSFVFIDVLLVIVAGAVLFSSKGFNKQVSVFGGKIKQKPTEQE